MKSFATRSQRDRAFDRLVQTSNHSTLIQRTVPMYKNTSNKAPAVIQRPVSPRKCVIVTSFTGDDDGDMYDEPCQSPSNPATKVYSFESETPKDNLSSPISLSSNSVSKPAAPTTVNNYPSESRSRNNAKSLNKSENKSNTQGPLRVTLRLQKCPSSSSDASVTSTATTSSITVSNNAKSGDLQKKSTAPLTLSSKRTVENAKFSESNRWEVSATDKGAQRLSSPPLVQNCLKQNESPPQGIKRKTTVESSECEQLEAFVSGVEERALPKRRMLQPTPNPSTSSSSASSSSDRCPPTAVNKPRTLLTQKILMTKSSSAPNESCSIDQSGNGKKRQSLLKKTTSCAVNRKAVYNPRQWIGIDAEEESSQQGSKFKTKDAVKGASNSTFDFDSDEEESTKTSSSMRFPPRSLPQSLPSNKGSHHALSASASTSSSRQSSVPQINHSDVAKSSQSSRAPSSSQHTSRSDQDNRALYTVVRNVKEAHECQESGETQDLLDDVEYMLDGLKASESPATRCLSLLRLCKECLVHSFRMTLKAHGLLPRIFAHVIDAPNENGDCGVALHTAALLFILSRDKLAAGDLEKEGLRILLRLLRCDGKGLSTLQLRELDRIRSRLRPVIEQVTKSSAAKSSISSVAQRLHITCFTAKDLAVESLLNVSVRKASDWFKNELRKEGGLDHFCHSTIDAMDYFNNELESQDLTEFMLDRLRRIEQYMRLLENMTYMNGANQEYLVQFEQRSFLDSIAACLRLCINNLPNDSQPDSTITKVIVACLLAVWRVMLNISHDNEKCSDRLGAHPLLIPLSLHCVLRLPQRLPAHRRFDMLVLALGFLVNLVEHCDENRGRLAYSHVRLPWRKRKRKSQKRRGLVLNPTTVQNDSSSDSSDGNDGSCSSSDDDDDSAKSKTALDALVKLFLERYEASERHELEQGSSAENGNEKDVDQNANNDDNENEDESNDGMKWRLIEDKQLERQRRGRHRPFRLIGRKRGDDGGESEEEAADDSDSDSGADVEFMPSTQEQTAALESALSRAGEHMEASMTASYVALLLGCMMRGSRRRVDRVQGRLPEGRFKPLALSLAKFLGFMSLTSAVGQAGGKSMLEVVHFLHELDGDNPDDDDSQLSACKTRSENDTVTNNSSLSNNHS